MKLRNTIRILLLAFVFLSLVVGITKSITISRDGGTQRSLGSGPDRIVVVVTHAKVRCPTCNRMEALTEKCVKKFISEGVTNQTVEFASWDYESPENRDFVRRHKIASATVLFIQVEDGKEVASENHLYEAWTLLDDETMFIKAFENHLRRFAERTTSGFRQY